ncbi:MAG: MAPEG family protein [Pseudomonadota bacterium]|nr:MAPEG family protein [Pseudomonadota bacterium]
METYIIYSLALTLLQLWIIPMALNFKNLSWMMSSRDQDLDTSSNLYLQRVNKSTANLYESLPAFLALALLSLVLGVDTSSAACVWLIARVGHLIFYVAGIGLLRTASWLISLGALVCMACALI